MRTTIAGTNIIVRAESAGSCLDDEEDYEGPEFNYKEGDLGMLAFDWAWDESHLAVAHITVIWDHDPEKLKRTVLLDHLTVAGVQSEHKRVLLMEV